MLTSNTCIAKPRKALGSLAHKRYEWEGGRKKDVVADSLTGTQTFGPHLCV